MSAGRPKATCWHHPGAAGWTINKVRLAPKLCAAPYMCLRENMTYFYCRQRPSRPHIKHLNSSPLCSHIALFREAEPESCVNIKVHTLLLEGLGLCFCSWSFIDWDWQKACKNHWWEEKIRYAMTPECSTQHTVVNNTTACSPAPRKSPMKYDT